MRILAIGLGGAGGRIVNNLYRTDRRSSKVACVQALAVDIDLESMKKLTDLPENAKIYFPVVDFTRPGEGDSGQTATIDIAEIAARAQTMSTGETDALFLVMGLGGSMADDAPQIITTMRSSMTEPIFALVTLPCLSEGARCSAKAADQIEMISPLVDGVILFDNETWQKKVKIAEKLQKTDDRGIVSKLGFKKKKEKDVTPEERMHALLNDVIIRRISLILRAGEFKADGGLDLAEVVLDSGEVLNTMKGMGFITIGYAVEQLPSHPLDFLTKLRPSTGYFADEHQKKASRIIDLAKQAIYHEISAPCDITSAHKALILIAGPSHELSMKGFMTVRKWIDRSIAELETRSGDYPVKSTRFVAIIIMLSGLENVPRITELREIRAETRPRTSEFVPEPTTETSVRTEETGSITLQNSRQDEIISLPRDTIPQGLHRPRELEPQKAALTQIAEERDAAPSLVAPQRPIVKEDLRKEIRSVEPKPVPRSDVSSDSIKKLLKSRPVTKKTEIPTVTIPIRANASEQERRKIEEELQRQREIAFGGVSIPPAPAEEKTVLQDQESTTQHPMVRIGSKDSSVKHVVVKKQTSVKKVVIHKRSDQDRKVVQEENQRNVDSVEKPPTKPQEQDLLDDWIQQVKDQKKTSLIDDSGTLKIDDAPGRVTRDDALIRTKKIYGPADNEESDSIIGIKKIDRIKEIKPADKKRNRIKDDEDISFVK